MRLDLARPEYLYLLAVLPLWWLAVRPRRGAGVLFSRAEEVRRHAGGALRGRLVLMLPRLLRIAAMAAVVVALAEPRLVSFADELRTRGISLVLAVDVSSSMLAEDMEKGRNRLEIAREAAVRFARGRTRDEIGLVAFSGEALTRVPLTTDPAVVVAGVESLAVEIVPDGTDIAAAIVVGTRRLLGSAREPRVLVLLTDGAHNGRGMTPLQAARAAAALGVRIHSISILGRGDVEDLAEDARAVVLANQRRMEAEMETVLSQVSRITGGEYHHASSAAALDSIYHRIDRLEPPIVEAHPREVRSPVRAWPLAAALILILLETGVRGSRWGVIA